MQVQALSVGRIASSIATVASEGAGHGLAAFQAGGSKKALIIGGLLAGGALAAYVGHRLLAGGGSSDGRNVGVAYGRKTINHADGTSEWASVTVPLLLDRHVGAAVGYATLSQAVDAAKPNTGNGEMAFVREGAGVTAFTLNSPGLEAVASYSATAPSIVAFTSRSSNQLLVGPAATADERAQNHLIDAPAPVPLIAAAL